MLLHLSQLLALMTGGLGIVAPIVMWAIAKDKSPQVDRHGKIVLNWIISCLIYGAVSVILIAVIIGALLLIVLGILAIVFPIIGAMKANNDGTAWDYPLSIKFFR